MKILLNKIERIKKYYVARPQDAQPNDKNTQTGQTPERAYEDEFYVKWSNARRKLDLFNKA